MPYLPYPREGTPLLIEWEAACLGPAAGLVDLEKRKISCPCQNSIPGSASP